VVYDLDGRMPVLPVFLKDGKAGKKEKLKIGLGLGLGWELVIP